MFHFIETIKLLGGQFSNLEYHQSRLDRTLENYFPGEKIDLAREIQPPPNMDRALYKCRVVYSNKINSVQINPYDLKKIDSIKVIRDDLISYSYKFENRDCFLRHLRNSGGTEILIVKNGLITDTSYSNIVFCNCNSFFTPAKPLLKGTKRESLLKQGRILEKDITPEEIYNYEYLYLINSMIDLEDEVRIPIGKIKI